MFFPEIFPMFSYIVCSILLRYTSSSLILQLSLIHFSLASSQIFFLFPYAVFCVFVYYFLLASFFPIRSKISVTALAKK